MGLFVRIFVVGSLTLSRQRGDKNTPSAVLAKKTVIFCDIVTDTFGFPKLLSVSLYLLSVLRGRSGFNVHETGFATSSNERRKR